MTPHKTLGQEVKNSTANWGKEEEGCRSRRLQWHGLEHSQHCVVNTSVVMKSTSVISGQNLTSQKAHPTAQWPFPSIRSTGLFPNTRKMLPLAMFKSFVSEVSFPGTKLHTSLNVLKYDKIFLLMSQGQANSWLDIFHHRQIGQRKL